MVWVFGLNAAPMVIGGLISGLLLRGAAKAGGAGRSIALWPTMIPAVVGVIWYLWGALLPAEADPGREYLAAPQYLVVIALAIGIVAWVGCRLARSRRAAA